MLLLMPMSDGAVFAGYTIVGLLTSGAVGEVYLAQHPRLPRQEELTILSAAASADPDFRRRFEHEAGIAAGLSHPHISAVRDRGEHDGRLWFTTDHLNGTAAATLLHTDSPAGMPTKQVCDIVDAIADALDYAHTEDLLHREVSPSHILLTEAGNSRRGRILLTDFGIARDTSETTLNTSTAALAYSSPEQLMGMALDGRTDQYSLAATTYHLLTGKPPFVHTNSAVLISNHLNSPPPLLADTHPNLAALDPVVARALSKDPTNRYNTCTEFAQALNTARSGHPAPTPSLAPPATATTTETDDLPQPPTTFSDWGTPKPPPPTPAPTPAHTSATQCFKCNHRQVVPMSTTRWACEQCGQMLKRAVSAKKPQPVQAKPSIFDRAGLIVGAIFFSVALLITIVIITQWDSERTATTTAPPVTITAPASTQPAPAAQPTTSRPPPTTRRSTSRRPATTTRRSTPSRPGNGDLGLTQPIRNPPCNGEGIVILGSVTTPGRYAQGVQRLLDKYPRSFYLRTDRTCPSLRATTEDGSPIYAAYLPGGTTMSQLCAAVRAAGGDAYGKWLNYTSDPDRPIRC